MHRVFILVALALTLAPGTTGCGDKVTATPEAPAPEAGFAWPEGPSTRAVLHVRDLGEIEIALYPELAPETVENFVRLAEQGFYNGTTFHRVIPGFMVQGGDPNTRDDEPKNDGFGGSAKTIADEFNAAPHERGVFSMANKGQPNTADSQFFIVHGPAPHLDGKHAVFGRVLSGMEVVDEVTKVDTDPHGRWGPAARPIHDVVVERIEIQRPAATAAEAGAASEAGAES